MVVTIYKFECTFSGKFLPKKEISQSLVNKVLHIYLKFSVKLNIFYRKYFDVLLVNIRSELIYSEINLPDCMILSFKLIL